MGSWNETCGVTQLPICHRDKIRAFVLLSAIDEISDLDGGGTCYSNGEWIPFGTSILGTYNDYGGIENIVEDEHSQFVFDSLKSGWLIDQEAAKRLDIPFDKNKLSLENMLTAIERSCATYSTFTRRDIHLGIMYVLDDVYQSIMSYNPIGVHFQQSSFKYMPARDIFLKNFEKWYTAGLESYLLNPEDKSLFRLSLTGNDMFYFGSNELINELKNKFITLIGKKISVDDVQVKLLSDAAWEMIHFDNVMKMSRKLWHPQCGKGSQDNNLEIHEILAAATLDIISKRNKEFEEENLVEKKDENGYYPYMLEHNQSLLLNSN